MIDFQYRAVSPEGQIVEGQLASVDEAAAMEQLRSQQLSPLALLPAVQAGYRRRGGRIRRQDISHMTSRLASLVRAGLPIAQALAVLEEQADTKTMQAMLAELVGGVREGRPLSEALGCYPQHFNALYRNMVRAGEVGSVLPETLERIADSLERDEELKKRVKGALTYPAVMVAVMILSVGVLLTFVVPRITGVFTDMGGALPWPTQVLLAVSDGMAHWWWAGLLVIGVASVGGKWYIRTPAGRLAIDTLALRIPILGRLLHEVALSRFALTLGSLLRSGVPVIQALDASCEVAGNARLAMVLRRLHHDVRAGSALSKSMRLHPHLFPPLLTGLVATGEDTGNLAAMMNSGGQFYGRECDGRLKTLTSLIEPVIILIMGVVVGFVIIAMLLPIFELTTSVR